MFFEFARIADTLRPRCVLVENVPGLLSSNGGRDFGTVLGTLADIGYGLAYRILDSRFFGVPQRRRRVFILGILAEHDSRGAAARAGEILAVGTRCDRHSQAGDKERKGAAHVLADGTGSNVSRPLGSLSHGGYRTTDLDGVPAFVSGTIKGFGKRGWSNSAESADLLVASPSVRRLTPVECERLQGFPDHWTQLGGTPDSRRYAALGDAVTVNVAEWIGQRIFQAEPRLVA